MLKLPEKCWTSERYYSVSSFFSPLSRITLCRAMSSLGWQKQIAQALLEINVSVSSTNPAIIVIKIILFGSFDFRKSRHLNSCRFSMKTQWFWHIVSFLCSKMCWLYLFSITATKEALNKSRHASCLHIFRSFGQPLCRLRRHLPPPGGDHILHENSLKYIKYSCVIFMQSWGRHPPDEKSVCAICIPDLISASLSSHIQCFRRVD